MKNYYNYIIFFIFLILIAISLFWQAPIEFLGNYIVDNSLLSISAFILLIFLATVFAPLTVLPIVPFVAVFFGPFLTTVYLIVGWVLGSIVAFWIARRFGKPVLVKFVSQKKIDKYKKFVPEDIEFWWVVFLHVIIPVDILGYLVGLFSKMSLKKYTLATFIGVIPFSFIFSYGLEIVQLKNRLALSLTVLFLLCIFSLTWYFHKKGRI
ncbi:hypothetical protein A2442_00475 [Candidatus Campbellbacteria bacterium RIFOXYC2_FULL_35_25]|uniref:TVP38/TMEM64 family membrane protein n=1 Tax=Candidatus Campbellbacteria bacterium RIFOXYC2_FULL_35_25 TaxID=1797582 RepID=A0A1F5EIP6_9BACT|nr:MAG: hypothetical protein A2442_00475 [Candidatus Campbellbacteria bacterium RIFOXYC2_FULL_35_25]